MCNDYYVFSIYAKFQGAKIHRMHAIDENSYIKDLISTSSRSTLKIYSTVLVVIFILPFIITICIPFIITIFTLLYNNYIKI